METEVAGRDREINLSVRFHLGSGINGNKKTRPEKVWGKVRFHLGSGINGNREAARCLSLSQAFQSAFI